MQLIRKAFPKKTCRFLCNIPLNDRIENCILRNTYLKKNEENRLCRLKSVLGKPADLGFF